MPYKQEHIKAGMIIGGLAGLLYDVNYQLGQLDKGTQEKWNIGTTLKRCAFGVGAGALGGMLPDILEPATNPRHRKFFHSQTFGLVVTGSAIGVAVQKNIDLDIKEALGLLVVGYLSHLVLDAQTPAGLPAI